MQVKLCRICQMTYPANFFHKRAASPDGLVARCKICQSDCDQKRANALDRVAARVAYKSTEAGKIKLRASSKAWAVRNPKKRAAHIAVSNALRDGLLAKPTRCQTCREEKPVTAHHDNYDLPLAIPWMCVPCHAAYHIDDRKAA